MNSSPILVTGSHRSGTTFTGKVLSLDKSVGLIYEPFNKNNFYGINRFNTTEWYQYVDNTNGKEHYSNFKETLDYNFSVDIDELKKNPIVKSLHLLKAFFDAQGDKILHKRPLVKDPIALFSTPWLAQNFSMNVVILIRHPAAFVSSVKGLNWSHDFKSFLRQPLLMNSHYLEPFREEIEDFAAKEYPIVEQASLLWRIFYSTVRHYQEEFPEWIYLKL
jgi:Sulfotransferase family